MSDTVEPKKGRFWTILAKSIGYYLDMSGVLAILLLAGLLTLLGSLALGFITYRYYWGERGRPPLAGEERRRQKEEELRMRAAQIEWAKQNPVTPRKPSFWDNTKVD
jgi:hypothetical protein